MENPLLYVKNQICEDFVKENQDKFPFLVFNTEPNIQPKQVGDGQELEGSKWSFKK